MWRIYTDMPKRVYHIFMFFSWYLDIICSIMWLFVLLFTGLTEALEGLDMRSVFRAGTTGSENKRLIELERMKRDLEHQLQEMARTVERQQEMIAMAKRDPLTGLRNRQGIPELVDAALRADQEGIFFIMDMDNFKCVNDTYGHMEGDHVLTKFARALKGAVDANDIVARLGGDEFVVFSPEHCDKYEVRAKAQRIVRQIERRLVTPGKLLRVTISMGIACAPLDGVTYEALYANADKALYSVKKAGKNGYRFYADLDESGCSDVAEDRPRRTLEEITSRLREKKMEGSFEVEYTNFEKIYRFMERNLAREHREVQCVLFTLEEYIGVDDLLIQGQLEHLQHAVASSLRKGDVTTKYSPTQVLALLMDVNRENTHSVVKRILSRYRAEAGRDVMHVLCDIRQLMADGE